MFAKMFLQARACFFSVLVLSGLSAVAPQKSIYIEHVPGLSNLSNSSQIRRSDGLTVHTNSFGIGDISALVAENPQALKHAMTANQQNRIASWWFWSTVPVGIAARLATYPLVEWEVITPKTGWIIFATGIAVSVIGALVSLNYFNNAKYSMYLGIKEYNQPAAHADFGAAAYFGGMSFRLR